MKGNKIPSENKTRPLFKMNARSSSHRDDMTSLMSMFYVSSVNSTIK